jgi:ubiquinone/menaquinone biosynthesis C-methylase UbiE
MKVRLNDNLIFHGGVTGSLFLCSMELNQAIQLIRTPHLNKEASQHWADLGSGAGLFTRALAQLIGNDSIIYAVDRNITELNRIPQPAGVSIQTRQSDFVQDDLGLSWLTGILMANSLHFVKNQPAFIKKMKAAFIKSGSFLIVEYDTDKSNQWVPYPLSFVSLTDLFKKAGYSTIEKINETPSMYNNNNIYAAWIE